MAKKEKIKKPKSKKRRRKTIRIIVSLAVVVALVVCGFIFVPKILGGDEEGGTTLEKRTSTVIQGDVVKTIGSSAPLETSLSETYKPEISGEIVELLVADGDLVSKGDLLITLDTSATDDSIESLESQIESKLEQIADKEGQIEDKYDSIDDKKEDIADKRDDITDLEDEIDELEIEIDENEGTRSDLNVYAPFDGTVFDVKVSAGDSINTNTVLATLTDTFYYEVELPFMAKLLDETIESASINYKGLTIDAEVISIADYTYLNEHRNEMVEVVLGFTVEQALEDNAKVTASLKTDEQSYWQVDKYSVETTRTEGITADVSGEILELHISDKQSVETGDLIAVIDGETIDNATESLENQIESLEEQIASINDTIDTYYENIDSYHEDIADINDEIADLKEDIADLEAEIEEEKEGYETAQITAGFDGIISNLKVAAGDSVNSNTTLFTLVSLENPSMVVSIDELDIAQLEIGQEAEIVIDALENTEDTPVNAIVTDIAMVGSYSGGVTTYDVTVMLTDPVEGLKLTMNATATIYIDKSEDTLYIPIEAITLQGDKSYVYVQDASATGTPVVNNNTNTDSAADTEVSTSRQAGGMRQGNFNTEDMTDEQKAAMEERMASMGMSQTQTASESVSDIAEYYTGTRLVEVTTGIYNELYIEVLDGLEEGDVVVLPPLYSSDSSETTATSGIMGVGGMNMGSFGGGTGMQRPTGNFGGGN